MSKESASIKRLWGDIPARKFLRMPSELLIHFKDIGLTESDLPIIQWIDLHQWGEKPAFPHPAKLAFVLKCTEAEAAKRLHDLKTRGHIALEPTTNNSRNYHQDIRPIRVALQRYINDNPNHCEVINRKSDNKGIDASSNRSSFLTDTSNSTDTSIPRSGTTTSLGDELNNRKENK